MKTIIATDSLRQPIAQLGDLTERAKSFDTGSLPSRADLPDFPDLPDLPDLQDLSDLGNAIADNAVVVGRRGTRLVRRVGGAGVAGVSAAAGAAGRGASGAAGTVRRNPRVSLGVVAGVLLVVGAIVFTRRRRQAADRQDARLAAVA